MPYTHLIDQPYEHTRLFTFLHSAVHYITSENTVSNLGMEYNPPTRMANTRSSLILHFKRRNHMTTFSDTLLWDDHIKSPLTTLGLSLHGLQIWPHLPAVHQRLLLIRTPNTHILFHHMRTSSVLNLFSIPLHAFNIYLCLQTRFQPPKLSMKISTRTWYNPFPYTL